MILVDTSVWIEYFSRKGGSFGRELERLISSNSELATADMVVMEVLQGIRDDSVHQEIQDLLLVFPVFSSGGLSACMKASAIFRSCRKRGLTIRKSVDCLLAVTAMENDLTIFHKDRDFDYIARVSPLKLYQFS